MKRACLESRNAAVMYYLFGVEKAEISPGATKLVGIRGSGEIGRGRA